MNPTPGSRHIRGVIIDLQEGKIVAKSFPHTEEFTAPADIEKIRNIPLSKRCEITKAYEGTIIRLFQGNVTKNWYLSTHRKINGRRSRWSGPSFGEMFDSIWGTPNEFSDYLKPGCCYVFLLSHIDNRLVCQVSEPCIYHVQTFEPSSTKRMKATFRGLLLDHPKIKGRDVLEDCQSIEKLINIAQNLDWLKYSGLLVTEYSEGAKDQEKVIGNCWKIIPSSYQAKRMIRGHGIKARLSSLVYL